MVRWFGIGLTFYLPGKIFEGFNSINQLVMDNFPDPSISLSWSDSDLLILE